MKEGRQIEKGERAQPGGNVVRLPRDWLGPRDQLVPFGPRATPPPDPEATVAPPSAGAAFPSPSPNAAFPSPSTDAAFPPPSPDDFWGEGAASLQDAFEPQPDDAPASRAPRRGRRMRRPAAVAGTLIVLVLAAWFASIRFGVPGTGPHTHGGARLNVAAVVTGGLARTVERGLAMVDALAGRSRARSAASPRSGANRRIPHHRSVLRAVHAVVARKSSPPAGGVRSASADTRQVSTATYEPPGAGGASESFSPAPVQASPPAPSSPSPSSGASVSATGQSGALGPVQSPNG